MTSQVPPAIPRKHLDRLELLRDVEYFSTELAKRLEALQKLEPSGRTRMSWQQGASVIRRVRSFTRHEADEHRRRAKQKDVA